MSRRQQQPQRQQCAIAAVGEGKGKNEVIDLVGSAESDDEECVYLVMHEKYPTYSMHLHQYMFSEPIETVNSKIVGIYKTEEEAEGSARNYFFDILGLTNDGESVKGGYLSPADAGGAGDWDEEVWVTYHTIEQYKL